MSDNNEQQELPFSDPLKSKPVPPTGEQCKARALAILKATRRKFVQAGQRVLLQTLLNGAAITTADDIRAVVKLPDGVNPTLFGAVPGTLAEKGIITCAGFVKSQRRETHARVIQQWRLVDRAKAEQWLAEHPAESAVTQ